MISCGDTNCLNCDPDGDGACPSKGRRPVGDGPELDDFENPPPCAFGAADEGVCYQCGLESRELNPECGMFECHTESGGNG